MGERLTRGARNIRWIQRHCRIPEGRDVGKPVKLRPWQKAEIRKIYDNPDGTRLALISFGKKNGKTSFAAFLLLLHLCGPEAVTNSQLYSTAQSQDQAATVFRLAAKVVRMSPDLDAYVVVRDTMKELLCPELGTEFKALSAEVATAHGKSPIFVVHDELGQCRGPVSQLYHALDNAMGAHESPMAVVISTQAPTDGDQLSILIDRARKGTDPTVTLSLYEADESLDPFSVEAIKQANPAYGDFLSAREVKRQMQDAKEMPSQEPIYRNYTLNQRVDVHAPFISKSVWQRNGAEPRDSFAGLPVFGGLDLSSVNDLTAKLYVAPVEGKWHVRPTFWLPGEGLREKARSDRVPYDVWAEQGFLRTTPGRTVDYEFVAQTLYEDCARLDIRKIAFDRWNFRHLRPWLVKAGFSEEQVDGDNAIFEPFGQGYQSMSPALRDLESTLLDGQLAHSNHPVLTMCAANAVVTSDPQGNRKLDKAKATGRIDGMVALAMAMAMASTYEPEAPPKVSIYSRPELWEKASA